MRGKGECDARLAEALQIIETAKRRQRKSALHIIIDLCNLTVDARKRWLVAAHSARAWCIFFDIPIEECRYRIQRRKNHPIIPPGSAGLTVLDTMEKQFQPPTSAEAFERIIRLSNENEVAALLDEWRVPISCLEIPDDTDAASESDRLLKFPRTPHAINLGAATRDDKVCSAADLQLFIGDGGRREDIPGRHVYVEEKIDGANIGIFISSEGKIIAQNRSHFITSSHHAQFAPLDKWLARHTAELWEILEPGRHILYGEWVYATHSVAYTSLPDWFIAYDIFDRTEGKFVSRSIVAEMLSSTTICHVPLVHTGNVDNIAHLQQLVSGPSAYGSYLREGIVVRVCNESSLIARCKLVRSDFIAGNERWNKASTLATNALSSL
jgi:atypical dual specificity phosphatase